MTRQIATILMGPSSLLREGVAFTIGRTRYKVTAIVETPAAVTPEAWKHHQAPSMTIILMTDPSRQGTEDVVRSLRELRPSECIVVLCEGVDPNQDDMLRAGANACILSTISPDVLMMSLDLLMARAVAMASLTEATIDLVATTIEHRGHNEPEDDAARAKLNDLTDREIDVLRAVALGESNKRIASRLSMREPTVKSHMRLILKKIGSNNRTQAAMWAIEHGLAGRTVARVLVLVAPLSAILDRGSPALLS